MRSFLKCSTLIFSLLVACSAPPTVQNSSISEYSSELFPGGKNQFGRRLSSYASTVDSAIVSSENLITSEVGKAILARGGNAVDAAIAVSFALSVYRPHSTGLGGGGFLLLYRAKEKETLFLDFRERAPKAATRELFDKKRQGLKGVSYPLYAGTPGIVAGLHELHKRFGTTSWEELLAPAITLARDGFTIYPGLARAIEVLDKYEILERYPRTKKLLSDEMGKPLRVGMTFRQPQLAKSLEIIAKGGAREFYNGKLSEALTQGSLIDREDLKYYQPLYRAPLAVSSPKFAIVSAPLPSSGGVVLGQMFGILGKVATKNPFGTVADLHLRAEVLKLSFSDRARYLGDPGFTDVPVKKLLSEVHISALAANFKPNSVIKVNSNNHQDPLSTTTSHFSIFDADGNVVSSTQSVNHFFGSAYLAGDTGVFLNNTLDDFSFKEANAFGLLGKEVNQIEPGKTPLSSMSPTIVFKNNEPVAALGSPGGPMIISAVANVLINYLEYDLSPLESMLAPRVHHQWSPNKLYYEKDSLSPKTIKALEALGHETAQRRYSVGNVSAVFRLPDGKLMGIADPRHEGAASGY